ncbi:hypothetical protein CEXT_151491 [Caerostris extrusa]|uniref:Uncharacterized protein n=1 Tax=Caerostris extrusa TaxID=172846 RepID=A0AAV4V7K3_CAEEX|nr:hypothetical protein CEXT_151491 [Caerostris extrusa]
MSWIEGRIKTCGIIFYTPERKNGCAEHRGKSNKPHRFHLIAEPVKRIKGFCSRHHLKANCVSKLALNSNYSGIAGMKHLNNRIEKRCINT